MISLDVTKTEDLNSKSAFLDLFISGVVYTFYSGATIILMRLLAQDVNMLKI